MEFKTIEYNSVDYIEMVELRNAILLEPIGLPYFDDAFAEDEESVFCGCYDDGELIACCVLTELEEDLVRFRQMAVQEEYQRKGVGSQLLSFAENVAREKGFKEVTLHAQRKVENFYLCNGYHFEGDEFVEAGIVHILMNKTL